ncbi:MAG: protein-glutamate O-methyltransferase CheR [Bdellovibrionales bacterium]|nr:protein-glutamate O-methyltransferase CheR [Bdellovibrionales bacterium]
MEHEVFEKFRTLIHGESGISLKDEKKVLLENRIRRRMNELRLRDPRDYLELIELDIDGSEIVHLLDAVSTNHTFFFREGSHFTQLAQILKSRVASGQKEIRIWCAASSTGEEPYTILMTAAEAVDLNTCEVKLLASDISMTVLQTASSGCYSEEGLSGVSLELRKKYFSQIGPYDYQIRRDLREKVLFKRLNLSTFPYPLKGSFDIIFCRNVMIYFERELRHKIVQEFHRLLVPGGCLFVGHSEASAGQVKGFRRTENAMFLKEGCGK